MTSYSSRVELGPALLDLGYRLAGVRTPEQAARIIVGVAQELLGWDACSLDLYFPETGTVQAVVTMDRSRAPSRWTCPTPTPPVPPAR